MADRQDSRSAVFQRLRVVSGDGRVARTVAEGEIISFYWSPGGGSIAWLDVDAENQRLRWWVESGQGNPAKELFNFRPSSDTSIMLSFFDQYGYSHTPWSPDGTRLVVAGVQGRPMSRRNGQTPTGDRIFVLDASGGAAPRELAAGTLAFWSWN